MRELDVYVLNSPMGAHSQVSSECCCQCTGLHTHNGRAPQRRAASPPSTTHRRRRRLRLQTHLLQYPLRPPHRPYTEEGFEKLQLKPKVKRLQAELAVEQGSGAGTLPKDAESITLRSARVDMRTAVAAGVLRGGRLFLMNIDEVRRRGWTLSLSRFAGPLPLKQSQVALLGSRRQQWVVREPTPVACAPRPPPPASSPHPPQALQMRPVIRGKEGGGGKRGGGGAAAAEEGEEEEEEAKPTELQPVVVQVKRRETEQQQEARLRSFAYLALQEEQDAWVDLAYSLPDSSVGDQGQGQGDGPTD